VEEFRVNPNRNTFCSVLFGLTRQRKRTEQKVFLLVMGLVEAAGVWSARSRVWRSSWKEEENRTNVVSVGEENRTNGVSVSNGIARGGGCVEREKQGVQKFRRRGKRREQRVFILVMGLAKTASLCEFSGVIAYNIYIFIFI